MCAQECSYAVSLSMFYALAGKMLPEKQGTV